MTPWLPELAVSVNGATDAVRRQLMPIDRRWSLADLRDALARWPLSPHRRLTLEDVLLADVNDDDDASAEWLASERRSSSSRERHSGEASARMSCPLLSGLTAGDAKG